MKRNQSGIGAIELVVILVVICLVGGLGWYAYRASNKTASPTIQKTSSNGDEHPIPKSEKFLEVPEMGVKFKLASDIADAYYDKPGTNPTSISLRVHSLDNEPNCKTGDNSLASLIKVGKDEFNPLDNDKKYSETTPGVVLGDYFYYIGFAQYSCVQNDQDTPLLAKIRSAFAAASSTIEKL